MFLKEANKLVYKYDGQTLWIEPWGVDSLRVRATMKPVMPEQLWALTGEQKECEPSIEIEETTASITNGKLKAVIYRDGRLDFFNEKGEMVLSEYLRNYGAYGKPYTSPLIIKAREFRPKIGADYELSVRFESLSRTEKIYGMGQYQQENLDLKGCDVELAQRNTQSSVPFMISSLGYGMLWNNPSIGKATFGTNFTTWYATSTDIMDYWVTVGEKPSVILENYAAVTGTVPMAADWAAGLWQSKLRYRSQEELLEVAREYKRRGVPLAVIVIDYFHWKKEGEWSFNEEHWPDVKAMVDELEDMGTKLMVSVWPTVQEDSENYREMLEKGYLIRVERGVRYSMVFRSNTIHFDATNPEARAFVWNKIKKNYYDQGIKIFWLDEAEPEYTVYDYDNYRYQIGSALQIGNVFPNEYAKTMYDGMKADGNENIMNLIRTTWAGAQKYGALLWSGDIDSTFQSLRRQIIAGLNSGLAGIAWWTSDIGGFRAGNINDPDFRELFVRWFEWATFCPVMRMHGWRHPNTPYTFNDGQLFEGTGASNEIWSYGEEIYEICEKFTRIRNNMHDYTMNLMKEAHEKGSPLMRPLFYVFPEDENGWKPEYEMQYMYGDDILVAPIVYEKTTERTVYLPAGHTWTNVWTKEVLEGGSVYTVKAEIHEMPIFVKDQAKVIEVFACN
ncbi:MAG: glycoside hydrolase family 31 protein [Lachnospiraceae bacterium]